MSHQNSGPKIFNKLRELERIHDIKIILAVEAGSRAYGLDSPDSDYDVRFIYSHRRDWYLSVALEEQRDVIELPFSDGLDIHGWDLRKSLRLFWKSNPGFIEWIQSETVYESHGAFRDQVKNLIPMIYSTAGGIHHYINMAIRSQKSCNLESPSIKTYLQTLRALLSALWLERHHTPAPIEFKKLYLSLNLEQDLQNDISTLVYNKRNSTETNDTEVYSLVHNFIIRQLNKPASRHPKIKRDDAQPLLSELFRSTLSELWD